MNTDPTSDDRHHADVDAERSAAEPARSVPAGSERAQTHAADAHSTDAGSRRDDAAPSGQTRATRDDGRRDERRDDSRHDDRRDADRHDERPRTVQTDPTLDEHQRQGVSGATWIALILGAIILVLLLIFIVQNNVGADFAYFGWQFSLPLGVAMLFAAIAGVLVTALLGSVRLFKLSRRVRRLEQERAAIKRAIG